MEKFLTYIRDALIRIKDTLQVVAGLANIARMHPYITAILIALALSYSGLRWLAFGYPARTISYFYKEIDARRPNDAWELLYPPYCIRWSNNRQTFCDGFRTTVGHTDLTIEFSGNTLNPANIISALFSSAIEFSVSFSVTDRFTKEDCRMKEQEYDCLWLQIKNQTEYTQLMEGKLITPEAAKEPSLELTRHYKKRITLMRVSAWSWLISKMNTYEEGIKR